MAKFRIEREQLALLLDLPQDVELTEALYEFETRGPGLPDMPVVLEWHQDADGVITLAGWTEAE